MSKPAQFQALVAKALAEAGRTHMRPVIEKELLHYDILFALNEHGLLNGLTFQGGTCLRLCFGSRRFSEDLDFVGGADFNKTALEDMKACLERYIVQRYDLAVAVRPPKPTALAQQQDGVTVDRWQLSVTTAPARPDLPHQRIKIEVANVPAYSREPNALHRNYSFLPDGYQDLFLLTESPNEIYADKLVSLVCSQKYIRHRDIWDLRFLQQQGATLRADWVKSKIADYGAENYPELLDARIASLDGIVNGAAFRDEMTRFLPADVLERTFDRPGFLPFLAGKVRGALEAVRDEFAPGATNAPPDTENLGW